MVIRWLIKMVYKLPSILLNAIQNEVFEWSSVAVTSLNGALKICVMFWLGVVFLRLNIFCL